MGHPELDSGLKNGRKKDFGIMNVISGLIFILVSFQVHGQSTPVQIVKPTGQYPVGTIIYEWTDESREFNYTSHDGDKRTIIVQLWYPAKVDSKSVEAPYSALSKDYQKVKSNSFLRASFTDKTSNSKLILISPGRGTERFLYTTLIEDLASHGFVVASIDMPGIGYTIYRDGLIIKPSAEYKPPRGMMAGPYAKVDSFFEKPTEIGYNDLTFAVQKISELNDSDPNNRFMNRITVSEIGIFGHSLGGRIAGEFSARNQNVKAYISMEGIPPRPVRFQGKIKIPIVMLVSSATLPYAIKNYNTLIDNRSDIVYMIELKGFGHNSVTDNPFIYPESFNYDINSGTGLEITRKLVTDYFKSLLIDHQAYSEKIKSVQQIKLTEHARRQ
jgi:hypothetical protein